MRPAMLDDYGFHYVDEEIEDETRDRRKLPRWLQKGERRLAQHWGEAVAEALLINAANDYVHYANERPRIESWIQGDQAPVSFDDVCTFLHLEDKDGVRAFIHGRRDKQQLKLQSTLLYRGKDERESTSKTAHKEHARGPLATHRNGRNGTGGARLERVLFIPGDLDRAEAGEAALIRLPNELD